MRVINISLSELETKTLMIGFEGENQITQVRIDAAKILTDYPNATPTLIAKPLFGFAYPVIVTKEGTDVVWEIDNSVLSFHGDGEIQLTFTEAPVIAKSYVGRIRIKRSLAVNGEAPDPIETWEQAATAKLAEVDAQIDELEDMVKAAEAAKDQAQGIVDDAASDIQAAGAAQVQVVQAKGTEVINSIPSDYTALTGEVSGLKSALSGIGIYVSGKNLYDSSKTTVGYLDSSTGAINPASTGRKTTDYIPVTAGKYLTISWIDITTQKPYSAPSICFFNSAKTAISGGNTWKTNLIVPSGAAYARVCVENSDIKWQIELTDDGTFTIYEDYFEPYYIINPDIKIPISQITNLEARLSTVEEESAESAETLENFLPDVAEEKTFNVYEVYTGPYESGYIDETGTFYSSANLSHSDKIPVKPGWVLTGITTDHTTDAPLRFVAAYNGDTIVPSAGSSADSATYTVPEGIDGIIVTQRNYTPKIRSVEIFGENGATKYVLKQTPLGYMRDFGDMQDGSVLHVSENNVKNNVIVAFSGNITSFNKILVGQRNENNAEMRSCYLEIDSTNVIVHTDQGDNTTAHGLTIANDIQVQIETENEAVTSRIKIVSSGQVYEDTRPHRWLCDTGFASAVSVGSVLTNCALSWTSRNINKPIWIFGDSYVSLYDVRWVYWMIEDGFANSCIINGYAGENSKGAKKSLDSLIAITKPRYLLWALGMNDGDSGSAVNTSWLEVYNYMILKCTEYGITPILATIPNVPTVNNAFKNAIIRTSGYRYIEFSKAVDPDEDGNWISGALSEDGVHPSVTGAKILYQRVLVDFPEITTL